MQGKLKEENESNREEYWMLASAGVGSLSGLWTDRSLNEFGTGL